MQIVRLESRGPVAIATSPPVNALSDQTLKLVPRLRRLVAGGKSFSELRARVA